MNNMIIQDIIDKYSPLVQGQTGVQKRALLLVSHTLQSATNILGRVSQYPFNQGYTNTAGQTISDCSPAIAVTLQRMERKLQTSFNKAANSQTPTVDSILFVATTKEVQNDVLVLEPFFNVRSGINFIGGEDYKFMVTDTLDLDTAVESMRVKVRKASLALASLS